MPGFLTRPSPKWLEVLRTTSSEFNKYVDFISALNPNYTIALGGAFMEKPRGFVGKLSSSGEAITKAADLKGAIELGGNNPALQFGMLMLKMKTLWSRSKTDPSFSKREPPLPNSIRLSPKESASHQQPEVCLP